MAQPKLSTLELQIMETLWTRGACSVRELQEAFPEKKRPAFTTVQTIVYRLEAKKALRCTKRRPACGCSTGNPRRGGKSARQLM